MARDDLHFRLRIPELLKDRVEHAAKANRRSMTAEIVMRLEDSFVPISYELDLDGTGTSEKKPDEWRRRQYYRALTEEEAVKQITAITNELNDAVSSLNEIREAREFAERRSERERD